MKRFFFKGGVFLEFILLFIHLYYNRKGLPIPAVDEKSRELIELMRTYEIQYSSGARHTLDQTIWGYDLTWASFVLFSFVVSLVVLRFRFYSPAPGRYVAFSNALLWTLSTAAALAFWSPPQQILFGLIALFFWLSFLLEWRTPRPKDTRVCVVGAGISGLTAAYQLHKQGYRNVTVLEKADYVGGKCKTDVLDDYPFDLGGHEMLAGYTDVVNIARELNAPTRRSIPPLVYDKAKKTYLGFSASATASGKYSLPQVGLAALRYLWLVGVTFRKYSRPSTGYKDMPAELAMPLEDWLKKRKLLPLSDILAFVIKVQGYGHFNDTSAGYLVKFQGFRNWSSLLLSGLGIYKRWPRVVTYGMQNLCERMAATLIDVRTGVTIDRVVREEGQSGGGVHVYLQGKDHPLVFDRLVLSTPLDPLTLSFMDLREEERTIFEKFRTYRFFTTLCKVQGLPAGVVASVPLNDVQKGEYTGYIKDFTEEPYAMFFTLADDKAITGQDVTASISRVLETVVDYQGVKPEVNAVIDQKLWHYFPHVLPGDIAAGFYDRLEALQGQRHTYYASSALSFECVGNSVAYSKRMVEKNFRK